MKKTLHIFFSALLILAACTREPVSAPDWVSASFTVETDADATKAVGDASLVDHLTVLAYDQHGKYLDYITFTCTQDSPGRFSAKARLVRGIEYTLLFFAQKEGSYQLSSSGELAITGNSVASDASRDAFYAVTRVVAGEAAALSVSLSRVFALLRFVSSPADQIVAWEEHRLQGIQCGVVLENVPKKINLLTGATEGTYKVEYSLAAAPSEEEMAFVFVPAGESEFRVNAVVTVKVDDFTSIRNITGIPLRRNCRTKIEGDFLTTEGTRDINLENN